MDPVWCCLKSVCLFYGWVKYMEIQSVWLSHLSTLYHNTYIYKYTGMDLKPCQSKTAMFMFVGTLRLLSILLTELLWTLQKLSNSFPQKTFFLLHHPQAGQIQSTYAKQAFYSRIFAWHLSPYTVLSDNTIKTGKNIWTPFQKAK